MLDLDSEIKRWTAKLSARIRNPSSLAAATKYVTDFVSRNLPPIFDFEHLSALVGVERSVLAQILDCPEHYYNEFSIPKNSGGSRTILSPQPSLKIIQDWIKSNILDFIPISPAAHGFVKQRSVVTFAKEHAGKSSLLHLDIKNFFPSIKLQSIYGIFRNIGYPPNVSFYLTKICTYEGALPQGAPTSPSLSNIFSLSMDKRLLGLASANHIVFSRYADNLVLSGDYVAFSLVKTIEDILAEYGLLLNHKKTYLSTRRGKRVIVGVSVTDKEIKLPRNKKREIRQEIYFLLKNGFFVHTEKIGKRDPLYMERLYGRLQFWRHLEPQNEFVLRSLDALREFQNSPIWQSNS
ncbi:MAG: reverse transcriptase domain-containing protein [Pseudomonadota bacterium]